jgi:hypothetical protein
MTDGDAGGRHLDGFSAALEVDVEPISTGVDSYDFLDWNSNGAGTTRWDNSHDFAEGKLICIRAGLGHNVPHGEIGGWSAWECDHT